MINVQARVVVVGFVLALGGCSSAPQTARAPAVEMGPTPMDLYEQQLKKRLESGDAPPVSIGDPNHQLVFCSGLSDAEIPDSGFFSFGLHPLPSISCQNTPDGERLLALRRWQCGERSDRNCLCGRRGDRDFFYVFSQPGYEAVGFGSFRGISRRELLPGETFTGKERAGPVTFGSDWDHYLVDSTTLEVRNRTPAVSPSVSLHPCRIEAR